MCFRAVVTLASPYLVRAFHAARSTSLLRHFRFSLSRPTSEHGAGESGSSSGNLAVYC